VPDLPTRIYDVTTAATPNTLDEEYEDARYRIDIIHAADRLYAEVY
jgi:hypothetical protein